ncbi:MAG: hypothetical protein ABIQ56_06405, partial [Chitinophagaceae bacterium]
MKKKCILFAFLFVTVTISSMAQQDQTLKNLLQNKTRLDEIMPVIKNYYKDPSTISKLGLEQIDRQLKQWQRWEWYMSSRLGPDGEFVNINQKMTEATGLQQKRNLTAINKTESTTSVAGNWLALGPLNTTGGIGRADRLAFHPNNANIVYAGTSAGGLWRTTDAGLNWTNLTPDISSAGISGIAIDPVNTNNIYILTGDGDSNIGGLVDDYGYMRLSIGVLKSTDGGNNWKRMGDFPGADYSTLVGYRLVIHPGFNYIIYACTSQGLYWSVNSGETWTLLKGGSRFFNLEFRPGSGSVFYATGAANNFSRSYFWRSTTSGFTMDTSNLINNQINNPTRRAELAVAPANPDLVYLLAGGVPGNIPSNPVPNQFKGLLLSNDGGLTFNLQSNTPNILGRSSTGTDTVQQSNYDLAAAVSNISSSTIVAGGVQMWRSLNSGTSWAYRGSGLHDDIHDLGFHPADNKLWAATDGGVYSSTDNGTTWISHFQDMNTTQFYRMAVSPTNYLDMIGGAQDNSVKRRTGATSFFDDIACCDGFAVGYDNVNSNILYAITNQSVNRSIDGGNNFNSITPPNTSNPFSMSMAVHTSLGNALFVGSDSVWRTTNGGANWAVTSFIQGGWFMRTCPSNGNRVYAAGGSSYRSSSGSLRRSDDGGVNWFAFILSGYPSFPDNYPKITCINVNPTNSANVWITFGGFNEDVKVYYSNDAGVTWFDRTGSLPNVPVNCIALDNNNNAYIGTDNGVYYRSTSMSDWIP